MRMTLKAFLKYVKHTTEGFFGKMLSNVVTCDVLKAYKITFDGLYSHAKQRHTNQTDISSVSCRGLRAFFLWDSYPATKVFGLICEEY